MTAAVYLRKSRADEDEPDALARHRETLLTFAKVNSIDIVEILEEIVSGENLYARPQMLKLLANVELNRYDSVLCMDIDRLGRGAMSSQGIILETFKGANCKIITPRRVYDLNNEIDEQYSEFETFMARQEYKMITRRMRRGIIASVKDGAHVGEVPFGYSRVWLNDGKKPYLAINPETAQYVKLAFDMYVNAGAGCQQIADLLNSNGVKPKKSISWGRTATRRILKNEIYTGTSIYNRNQNKAKRKDGDKNIVTPKPREEWIVIKNAFPAIVTQELFDSAQEIFTGRQHSAYFTGEFKNPLAGLVHCGVCSKKLQRQHQAKSQKYIALHCPTPGCSKAIKLEFVEQAILQSLSSELKHLASNKQASKAPKDESQSSIIKALNQELVLIKTQRTKTYDLLEQGVYTIDVFTTRNSDLAIREKKALTQLEKLNVEKIKSINFTELCERIKNVIKVYKNTDSVNQKNTLLRSVISKADYFRPKDAATGKFSIKLTLKGY